MEHPNATEFRRVMDAASRGDVSAMYENTHEDFVSINDIGAGPWREIHGRDAFFAFFGQFVEYLEGTFRQDIMDVIGYDDHVVAIVHETGTRQGPRLRQPRQLPVRDRRRPVGVAAHDGHGPRHHHRVLGRGRDAGRRARPELTVPHWCCACPWRRRRARSAERS